jgi:hypothetical protein
MSLKMKIWTLSLLWIAIVCTAVFAIDSLVVRIILAMVASGVTVHIALLRVHTTPRAVSVKRRVAGENK